jgi:hypothetical protein
LGLAALGTAFRDRFCAQGWALVDAGADGPIVWGRCKLERDGELWEMVFLLAEIPL